MKFVKSALLGLGLAVAAPNLALAASCYDLWYERNAIFDDHGFCFSTPLGRDTFDNSDCTTKSPKLSAKEQRRVNAILAEEKRRGCKVN